MMLLTIRTFLLKPSATMAASGVVRNVEGAAYDCVVNQTESNVLWGTAL